MTLALVAALSLALGLALGWAAARWWVGSLAGLVPPPEPLEPAPSVRPLALALGPVPVSPAGLERWRPASTEVARALFDAGPSPPEQLVAECLAVSAAQGWSAGVTDLRGALVASSPLPPAMVDDLVSLSLDALEREASSL